MPIKKSFFKREPDPVKEALKDPEVKEAVSKQAELATEILKEGYCEAPGCSNPVAPGQNHVCLMHIRRD